MQEDATKNDRKRKGSPDNLAEPEPESIPKKSRNIETSDRTECQRAIMEILSQQVLQEDTEIVIEHKGDESIEELIQVLFEIPSSNAVNKVKEALTNRDTSEGETTIKNVVIAKAATSRNISVTSTKVNNSETLTEENKGNNAHQIFTDQLIGVSGCEIPIETQRQVLSEKLKAISSSEEKDEHVYQLLVEKLKDVEGFQTEPWGSRVCALENGPFYQTETEGVTEKEKEDSFREFLHGDHQDFCSDLTNKDISLNMSSQTSTNNVGDNRSIRNDADAEYNTAVALLAMADNITNISNSENETRALSATESVDIDTDCHRASQMVDNCKQADVATISDTSLPLPATTNPSTSVHGYENLADIDISNMPDEAITTSFIFDYLLSTTNCNVSLKLPLANLDNSDNSTVDCSNINLGIGNTKALSRMEVETKLIGNDGKYVVENGIPVAVNEEQLIPTAAAVSREEASTSNVSMGNANTSTLTIGNADTPTFTVGNVDKLTATAVKTESSITTVVATELLIDTAVKTESLMTTVAKAESSVVIGKNVEDRKTQIIPSVTAANPEPNLLDDSSVKTENTSLELVPYSPTPCNINNIKSCKVVLNRIEDNLGSSSNSTEASLGSKISTVIIKERLARKLKRTYDEWQRGKALQSATTPESVANSALATAKPMLPLERAKSSSIEEFGKASSETTPSVDATEKIQHRSPLIETKSIGDRYKLDQKKLVTANATGEVIIPSSLQSEVMDVEPILDDCKQDKSSKKRKTRASSTSSASSVSTTQSSSRSTTKKPKQAELEELMKREMKNGNPDLLFLSDAMAKTFSRRKKVLENPNTDLNSLLNQYPALTMYTLVKEEYGRILTDGRTGIEKLNQLEEKLTKHFDVALNSKKLKKKRPGDKRHRLSQDTINRWQNDPNCSTKMKQLLGMLALCFHLVENYVVTHLCRFRKNGVPDTKKMTTPTLVLDEHQIFDLDTEMWVYVDGEKYMKVPNFYEGVLSVYATYYVFNIVYDRPLKALFEFFDVLLGNEQSTYQKDFEGNV